MAGPAGNVSGFSALWSDEIYRSRPPACWEQHHLGVERLSVLACFLFAQAATED
jgi:hypothetical protein